MRRITNEGYRAFITFKSRVDSSLTSHRISGVMWESIRSRVHVPVARGIIAPHVSNPLDRSIRSKRYKHNSTLKT